MEDLLHSFKNKNFLSIVNKNKKFSTAIYYNKNDCEFIVLLITNGEIMGQRYSNVSQIYEFIKRNTDPDGTHYNVQFNYSTETSTETKGRIFYAVEHNKIFELILLLI